MDGWLAGWLAGWPAGWLAGWLPGWLAGWMAGWMDGCMDGWMDGCMDGWIAGWIAGAEQYDVCGGMVYCLKSQSVNHTAVVMCSYIVSTRRVASSAELLLT